MHPVAKLYFELSPEQQKSVHIELCAKAYDLWLEYVLVNEIHEYQETVVGTVQRLDHNLPKDAIESVLNNTDLLNVNLRYQEPIAAIQDCDLEFVDDMEMAYYSIFNLYRHHVIGKLDDSWIIVNQALSALGSDLESEIFKAAVKNAK